jgi:MATE family multidrug resistance protein
LSLKWSISYGVAGVGAASAVSQWSTLVIMSGLWGWKKKGLWIDISSALFKEALFHRQAWVSILLLNANLMVRTLVLLASFGTLHWVSGQLGGVYVALNALFLHLQSLHAFALDGFAHGAEVLIGQAYGQRNQSRLRMILKESVFLTCISALLLTGLYWIGSGWVLGLLTNESQLLDLIPHYQIWIILTPLLSAACFLLDGVAIGFTASKAMRKSMIQSGIFYLLSLLLWVPLFHNHGIWIAFLSFMIARAFTLWIPLSSYFRLES